jgi:hypothetical protein
VQFSRDAQRRLQVTGHILTLPTNRSVQRVGDLFVILEAELLLLCEVAMFILEGDNIT